MLPSDFMQRGSRPRSEIIPSTNSASRESDQASSWREELQQYERNLEEMTSVKLDPSFKDELEHVDKWFRCLSETERTATVYSLLQHSSPVQIRFFISVLQQLLRKDPHNPFLTPANPEKDMQSQLTSAMTQAELEASRRLLSTAGPNIGRPLSTGAESSRCAGTSNIDRHSFALGDADDYSRVFTPLNSSNNPLNFNLMDDLSGARTARLSHPRNAATTAAGQHQMLGLGNRPRSVIEGDTSFLFSSAGSSWLNPPTHQSAGSGSTMGRISSPAERPKSADISLWTLPSFDISKDDPQLLDKSKRASMQAFLAPSSSGMNFSDLSFRKLDADLDFASWDKRRRAGRNNIPGTLLELDEQFSSAGQQDTTSSSTAVDSANLVLSPFDKHRRANSPVPAASASAPFSRRQQMPPPGMERHYGQYLNPSDAMNHDEHDYLSDHSEASNVSVDGGNHNRGGKRHFRQSYNHGRIVRDKKASDTVDMELLEDVPAWFRTLRLHKYNSIFEPMKWQDIIKLTDEDLQAKGVAALGARRKMLKVFENIRAHCEANKIPY